MAGKVVVVGSSNVDLIMKMERLPRPGETVTEAEFAQVFGKNWYGTPEAPVDEAIARGRIVILDIDVHGAKQVRERRPEVFGIFILPPSEAELHRRLADRGREDAEAIERRFAEAKREIAAAKEPGLYDAARGIGINPSDNLRVTPTRGVRFSSVPFSKEWSFLEV